MRLFVAIVPPPAALARLDRQLGPLRAEAEPGLRWSTPDSWHITLAFLGEVPEPVLPELSARLAAVARTQPAPTLALLGGLGFPRAARAWAVTAVVHSFPGPQKVAGSWTLSAVEALAAAVAQAAREAGAPPPADDPPYRAHLTIARLRPAADVTALLHRLAAVTVPRWRAAEIRLIRSELGAAPSGAPRYAELARWPLAGPAGEPAA
jgi:RNA 2',3'-cyclic 3'-phosphodiesterase